MSKMGIHCLHSSFRIQSIAHPGGTMDFEKHLFISYAHIDNLPLSPEQKGWISRFHDTLNVILSQRLGKKAIIWRDQKLAGNDVFASEIVAQFPKTAVLISVLSPRYLASDWCKREVEEFCKVAEHACGLLVGNKCRVVKVIKSPVDRNSGLPDVMKSSLGYQFYDLDEDNTPLELDPVFGPEMAQKYNIKVAKLAWEIAVVLNSLAEMPAPGAPSVENVRPEEEPADASPKLAEKLAVYLAECSFDQRDAREALEAELKFHGYRVLPDHQLPREESDYITQVTNLLAQCRLSIHLVGSAYGSVPDGPTEKSVVVLQNELATQASHARGLHRIIWVPENLAPKQDEQQEFILKLKTDAESQYGADLITSSERETLKTAMHAALAKSRKQVQPAPAGEDPGEKVLYLICDQRDRPATIPLRKFLKSSNMNVRIPVFDGDAATVRQANEDLLKQCCGVVIFYGEAGEAWKRSVDSEVKKMRGTAAQFPVWTYLADPPSDAKNDMVELDEPRVANCIAGFSEAAVAPLVQALEKVFA